MVTAEQIQETLCFPVRESPHIAGEAAAFAGDATDACRAQPNLIAPNSYSVRIRDAMKVWK